MTLIFGICANLFGSTEFGGNSVTLSAVAPLDGEVKSSIPAVRCFASLSMTASSGALPLRPEESSFLICALRVSAHLRHQRSE